MRPLRIVGPSDAGKTTLVERLVPKLAQRGPVATIKHLDCRVEIDEPGKDTYRHRAAGAAETYGVMPDASWFATGRDRRLGELLVDLAPEYAFVVIEGYSWFEAVPAVVLGCREHAGPALAAATCVESVDIDGLIDRLEQRDGIETETTLGASLRTSVESGEELAVGTCTISLPTADGSGRLDAEERETLETALERCRVAGERDEAIAAVETHHNPALTDESGSVGLVAVGASTHADATEAVRECGARVRETLTDATVELTTTWIP